MRAGLAASTVTPGKMAPDSSFTRPTIDACAQAKSAANITPKNTSRDGAFRRSVRGIATHLSLAYADSGSQGAVSASVYPLSGAHHLADLDRVVDVRNRVGVEQQQICGLGGSNRPVVRVL